MAQAERAPWPEQWAADRSAGRALLTVLGLGALAVVAVATALYHLFDDWFAGFKYVAVFAVLLAELALVLAHGRLRARKAGARPLRLATTRDASAALEMPYSRLQFAGFAALALTAAAPFVLGMIGALEKEYALLGRAVVLAVAALALLTLPMSMLYGTFVPGYVQLSPEGIHHRGWTHESYLPWPDVADVRAVLWDGPEIWVVAVAGARWPRRQIARLWRQDRLPESAILRIPARDLAGDPALLYALVRYYHENPEARSELGTLGGTERARAEGPTVSTSRA